MKPWKGQTSRPSRTVPPVSGASLAPRCGQNAFATQIRPVSSRHPTTSWPIHCRATSLPGGMFPARSKKNQPRGNGVKGNLARPYGRVGSFADAKLLRRKPLALTTDVFKRRQRSPGTLPSSNVACLGPSRHELLLDDGRPLFDQCQEDPSGPLRAPATLFPVF